MKLVKPTAAISALAITMLGLTAAPAYADDYLNCVTAGSHQTGYQNSAHCHGKTWVQFPWGMIYYFVNLHEVTQKEQEQIASWSCPSQYNCVEFADFKSANKVCKPDPFNGVMVGSYTNLQIKCGNAY